MKKIILYIVLLFSAFAVAGADTDNLASGNALFKSHCTSCHAIQSRVVGPALNNVFKIRSEKWIISFVHSSQTVIKGGDTAAISLFKEFNETVMPNHPDLSDQDIKNIIGYIKSESVVAVQAQTTGVTIEEDNDPYKGESGLVRQLVYIDVPGQHLPLKFSDYGSWLFIGGMILIFLVTLGTLIKGKSLIASFAKKEGNQDKVQDVTPT